MHRIKVEGGFSGWHSGMRDDSHCHVWRVRAHFLSPGKADPLTEVPYSKIEALLEVALAPVDGKRLESAFLSGTPVADRPPVTDEMIVTWVYESIREALVDDPELNGRLALEKVEASHRDGASVEYFEGMTNVMSRLA